MKDEYKDFWRKNLPHIQPEGIPLFVNYNLKLDLPDDLKQIISKRKSSSKIEMNDFIAFDQVYDNYKSKMDYLILPEIAQMVFNSLLYLKKYAELHTFTIMPNHIHLLMTIKSKHSLSYIMQNHKRFTSRNANIILNRNGQFWHYEYYDHYIRNDNEFYSIVWYIINNPVKANLVTDWKQWKYTWINNDILNEIE